MPRDPIFRYAITIPTEAFPFAALRGRGAVDGNGHVNNVPYVQWMHDAAVRHYESMGGIPPTQALGAICAVRSHHIEYLRPAFAGDEIEVRTRVVNDVV